MMKRKQRSKLLTFALISVLLTGSFGAAASAAEADAAVTGESVVVSAESGAEITQKNPDEGNDEEKLSFGEPVKENGQENTAAEDSAEGKEQEVPLAEESGEENPQDDSTSETGKTSDVGGTPEDGTTWQDGTTPEQGAATEDGTISETGGSGQTGEGSGTAPEDGTTPQDGTTPSGDEITESAQGTTSNNSVEETTIQTLDTPQNVCWKDTTTLSWDAVESAGRYRVTVWLQKGTQKYSKVVFVTGRNSYDVEEEIISLIKSNRKTLTGAAYTISAAVQAQSTDTEHFTDGKAAAAPSFRYLRTTYLDAIERNGWYLRNNNWYYYENGEIRTGWIAFCGERYYLNKDGVMLKNCWYSGCYLGSSGAMAKNEWVDNYQYYVGANGKVVEGTRFSTRNWVQTKAGWRYKKSNGNYVKNAWLSVNYRRYYFDEAGHMVTGWLTLDGNKYYLKDTGDLASGLGASQTGWVRIRGYYYWFGKDGALATSQWVDRGQYYVGASGKRLNWISYAALRNVNTSNRLGYDIYSSASPPEQSVAAYNLAYENGNRILVIDLRFTKDNVPVCFHDDVVKYARNTNGKEPAKKPTVSKMTYAELCKYDYGIYRGTKYKGTAPLTLGMMAAWIRRHADAELYIEVKADAMNTAQVRNLAEVIGTNGITDQCSVIFTVRNANDTRAARVHKLLPSMRIGITTSQVGSLAYSQLDRVKGNNETFVWGWSTTTLSASIISVLQSRNALFECGTFKNDLDEILSYYAKGTSYSYNSGVETPGAVFHKLLSTATYHDKPQWVSTDKGWKYQKVDKTFARSAWLTISGKKYYVNANGIRQTGWLNQGGKMYYFDGDGAMVTGWKTIASKKYFFGEDGVMYTGWQVVNGRKILFNRNGAFVKKV